MSSDNNYKERRRIHEIPSNRSQIIHSPSRGSGTRIIIPTRATRHLSEVVLDEKETEATIFQSRLANTLQHRRGEINVPLRSRKAADKVVLNRPIKVVDEFVPHYRWLKLMACLYALILIGLGVFILIHILPLIWMVTTSLRHTIILFVIYIVDRFKNQDTTNILQNIASLIAIMTSIITIFTLMKKRAQRKQI